MKQTRHILTLIFSAYLLLITVMPCSDAHSKMGAKASVQVSQSGDDHHDFEICSPFCVCSSCTAAVVLQPVITFEPPQFEDQAETAASFYKSVNSSFYGSIWQPPQLI